MGILYDRAASHPLNVVERNTCTVVATAIAADVPYERAYSLCKLHGRKRNRGMPRGRVREVIRALGCKVTRVVEPGFASLVRPGGARYTPKTIGRRLKHGVFH